MDAAGALEKYKTKISLSYDGNNSWMAPAMFQSICKIDIKYFPFDEQHCQMKFASWAYDVSKLDVYVNPKETGLQKGIYQPSNEWHLVSVDAVRNEVCTSYQIVHSVARAYSWPPNALWFFNRTSVAISGF